MQKSQFVKWVMRTSLSLLFLAALCLTIRAAGEVDTSFKATAYADDGLNIKVTAVQPDGKILVGGSFTTVNGVAREGIVRLNTDGTIDLQFIAPSFFNNSQFRNGGEISSISVQSTGKIIVTGQYIIPGTVYKNIARLNADGSLDSTFANLSAAFPDTSKYIYDIKIAADDTIYINGHFTFINANGVRTNDIAKLNADGSVDYSATFPSGSNGGGIASIAIQPDGKILATPDGLVRYMPNGSLDATFPAVAFNGTISKIFVQPDGKILIAGSFTTIRGFAEGRIARLNADGSLDNTFNVNGAGAGNQIEDFAVGADGKIYITPIFTTYNNIATKFVVRLNSDGTLDDSFTLDPALVALNVNFGSLRLQSDGKVLLVSYKGIYRTNPNGTIDSSFNPATYGRGGLVSDVIQQPDGKILASGFITAANGVPRNSIVRYNLDGTLDTTFNSAGFVSTSSSSRLAIQSDGKIVFVGSQDSSVVRLNSDGSRDATFSSSASASGDVKILADGKIFADAARLNSNGSFDTTYTTPNFSGSRSVLTNEVLPNGKYLIGGSFTQVNGVARGNIARLNNDGTIDLSFNPPFGANGTVYDIEVQADGKVIVVGAFTGLNGTSNPYIGRLNVDGSLDTTYSPAVNASILTAKLQTDGKLLIGGFLTMVNGVPRNRYARLNIDGTLDNSFDSGGSGSPNDRINRIALQSDGSILLGGYFARIGNVPVANIARLLNNRTPRTLFDYDGDGRADLSVFRPSNGTWYIARPTGVPAQNFDAVPFGQAGDKLVPADYDGDGRTDIAVFRNGDWYLNRTAQGFSGVHFGQSGDIPAPADFDGDGKTDLAVFRPSTGAWYVNGSSAGFYGVQFGQNGDQPVAADYGGDGKADIAVYRAGVWYIQRSSLGFTGISFGTAADKTVAADYDGDGKTDLAVFRPSNGTWYVNGSTVGFYGIQFGQNGDLPIPADYDGDGKADLGVFRGGAWYLQRSTAGFTGVQFGNSNDLPTPNSFVR